MVCNRRNNDGLQIYLLHDILEKIKGNQIINNPVLLVIVTLQLMQ